MALLPIQGTLNLHGFASLDTACFTRPNSRSIDPSWLCITRYGLLHPSNSRDVKPSWRHSIWPASLQNPPFKNNECVQHRNTYNQQQQQQQQPTTWPTNPLGLALDTTWQSEKPTVQDCICIGQSPVPPARSVSTRLQPHLSLADTLKMSAAEYLRGTDVHALRGGGMSGQANE